MIYKNDSIEAVLAMERARTGNYGMDEYSDYTNDIKCEICGSTLYECIYVDRISRDCMGCDICVKTINRDMYICQNT